MPFLDHGNFEFRRKVDNPHRPATNRMTDTTNTLKQAYTNFYLKSGGPAVFPNEYVVRIFRGKYPRLSLGVTDFHGMKICDLGCGDGRNILPLAGLGFESYGMEITAQICNKVQSELEARGVFAMIRPGENSLIPFENDFFDYLLSWNSCYYMGPLESYCDFDIYVQEFFRVLKPSGKLVLSIPRASNFIFEGSEEINPGYRCISHDPYGIRNGQVMRCFSDEDSIVSAFGSYFQNFVFGHLLDDCFGQKNDYFLMVCDKKNDIA